MSEPLAVVVPVRWSGLPYLEGSTALAYLGADGRELLAVDGAAPPGALVLQIRPSMRMRDRHAFDRARDDVGGGPANTVDLDLGYEMHQAVLQAKYEQQLWPEGRPQVSDPAELAEQVEAINQLLSRDDSEEAKAFRRIATLKDDVDTKAELIALLEGPREWLNLVDRELEIEHIDAITLAYRVAKQKRDSDVGKVSRSAA